MANWFNRKLTMPKIKHSTFDLSNDYKTSIRIGKLVPVGLEEIIPSDKLLSHSQETFIRFAPLKFPVMHKIKVHTSNFFVPFRIILGDDLYEDFLNNVVNLQPVNLTINVIREDDADTINPFVNGVLDYLGYDVYSAGVTRGEVSDRWTFTLENPLPYLSYLCICRDWYTDSVLEDSYRDGIDTIINQYRTNVKTGIPVPISSLLTFQLFNVSYTKDYFNTARPEPQLGPQMYVLNRPFTLGGTDEGTHFSSPVNSNVIEGYTDDGISFTSNNTALQVPHMANELTEETTIRDLWKKEMLQRYYEIDNTFGSRIREKLAGHYGVRYSDSRLQIPLFCGGSSSYAQISEVMSHSDTDNAGLGQYAGKAVVASKSRSIKVYFEEHGYYLTLLSLIPDNGYCRGQQRTFFKTNIFDFASPEFNNIGYQDVYNGELFMSGDSDADKGTFGYQPRYSEYRSHPSRCTGNFRGVREELAYHLNRNFEEIPPLNSDFIKVSDTERIFSSEDIGGSFAPLYCDIYHHIFMSRPISYEPSAMHLY